jgi:hypothetical protein
LLGVGVREPDAVELVDVVPAFAASVAFEAGVEVAVDLRLDASARSTHICECKPVDVDVSRHERSNATRVPVFRSLVLAVVAAASAVSAAPALFRFFRCGVVLDSALSPPASSSFDVFRLVGVLAVFFDGFSSSALVGVFFAPSLSFFVCFVGVVPSRPVRFGRSALVGVASADTRVCEDCPPTATVRSKKLLGG